MLALRMEEVPRAKEAGEGKERDSPQGLQKGI